MALKSRGVGGSGDPDESSSEGEDVAERPRHSIHDQLDALEEGQARLHRDFEGLRDSLHRHQREQQSWYTGIVRFLTCLGKKQGATNEDFVHLEIPPVVLRPLAPSNASQERRFSGAWSSENMESLEKHLDRKLVCVDKDHRGEYLEGESKEYAEDRAEQENITVTSSLLRVEEAGPNRPRSLR
ncbi:hypothetical protein LIER_31224 [Lithospermum erythrorhizon]|uniref:Uncharacterized protein n=1 Tax=Lithospermum erythrorhizon TaxID=34254 RepID=A0AAV3RU90_LITER